MRLPAPWASSCRGISPNRAYQESPRSLDFAFGATFCFRVVGSSVIQDCSRARPSALLSAAYGARPANSTSGIMSDPLHILVVEDEKAMAHMIAIVLGGPASKVATARSGWEALIRIGVRRRPFD